MEFVERNRSEKLYEHNCSNQCKKKGIIINFKSFTVCTVFRNVSNLWFVSFSGCGKLYVADGNWKLRYAHCMWKVPMTVSGFGDVNYPTICPLSPDRGHAFCKSHAALWLRMQDIHQNWDHSYRNVEFRILIYLLVLWFVTNILNLHAW